MKRTLDVIVSSAGLLISAPVLLPVMFLIWLEDRHSPFYIAERVGLEARTFKMVKLRSMIQNADKTGVDSTSNDDARITPVGFFIRKWKLDELVQLWNVLVGDMSLVGPRPNVRRETDLYTSDERLLLSIKPGITDFSSIVFSDEGVILSGKTNPDISYHQLIRPGKSRLGLFYINNQCPTVDLQLIFLTVVAIFSRELALTRLVTLLKKLGAPAELCVLASRKKPLTPQPPPGAYKVVSSRDGSL
jgi:lipopolysaccharide/colanic/teichoic acid biosynthesis glycosyltransferase